MGFLLVGFFVFGPRAFGNGIDETLGALLGLGIAFAWWTRRRPADAVYFEGADVADLDDAEA
jgi:hypothetical protein